MYLLSLWDRYTQEVFTLHVEVGFLDLEDRFSPLFPHRLEQEPQDPQLPQQVALQVLRDGVKNLNLYRQVPRIDLSDGMLVPMTMRQIKLVGTQSRRKSKISFTYGPNYQ